MYMNLPIHGGFSFLIGLAIFYVITYKKILKLKILYLYSFIFSCGIVLSHHIVINGGSWDLWDKNYISKYNLLDIIVLILLTYILSRALAYLLIKIRESSDLIYSAKKESKEQPVSVWDRFIELKTWKKTLLLFFCWLPWGLVWYPGFVFWDSITSVLQALGIWGLNNHHPILYTLWVKIWILLGTKIHNQTFGCALYSIVQMLIMGYCTSWAIKWMHNKGFNSIYCAICFFYFALNPFIAQTNLAMWKDPLFSIIIVIFALKLYDYLNYKKIRDVIVLFFLSILICGIRNNGPYVLLFISIGIFCIKFFFLRKIHLKKIIILGATFLSISICSIFIENVVFGKLGWNQSYAETVGLPLNQMARIVAYDGRLSSRNRDFMNNLYPIEKIKEVYAPGLIDRFKWAQGFNAQYLGEHKKEFFSNYISMIAKNPKIAFEAWELNTIGYWSLNHFTYSSGNLATGNFNSLEETRKFGHDIKQKNLLENKIIDLRQFFDRYDATFSLGIITWSIILLLLLAINANSVQFIALLLPFLGVIVSLLIATPSFYWERYGYSLTLIFPLLLGFVFKIITHLDLNSD